MVANPAPHSVGGRPVCSAVRHARLFGLVATLVAVVGFSALGPIQPSMASHANTQCQYGSGWYGGPDYFDQVFMPPAQYINWTVWHSNLAYVARRHYGHDLNVVTYEQYWPGDLHSTTTEDGLDRYRISSMTRGGYTAAWWEMVEYSHESC